MCLAQGPQRNDAGEAQTRGPSVSSQALYHWATALPKTSLIRHNKTTSVFRRPLLFQISQSRLNAYSMPRLLSDHDHICLLFKRLQSISGLFLSNFRSEISSKSKFIIFPPSTHTWLNTPVFCFVWVTHGPLWLLWRSIELWAENLGLIFCFRCFICWYTWWW